MRISLIPWELIWVLCLILLVITGLSSIIGQIKQRRLHLKRNLIVYILLLLVGGIPFTVSLAGYRFTLAENNLEATAIDHPRSDLRSRIYETYAIDEIYDASLRVIQQSRSYGQRWTIIFAELEPNYVGHLTVQIPALWGVDELSITIQHHVPGASRRVFLLSQTRERERDFGENARHIRYFYEALEAELAKSP